MKHKKWITVLMLLFVPLIAAAQLAPTERIVMQVPFKFTVGNVAIPGGEIIVQSANEQGSLLLLRNRDARVSVFTLPAKARSNKAAPVTAMVFHKYGDRYFLTGLKIGASNAVYEFRQSKLEKEFEAQNLHPTQEVLRASTN
ncbi:MAG TPA: hypothetical protein VJP02_30595 [Candidatus Sulfotelmatobacter sp.]|nr:hypothetical protein [Candidatus Sulfotelmatobacter sp.]